MKVKVTQAFREKGKTILKGEVIELAKKRIEELNSLLDSPIVEIVEEEKKIN